VNTVKSNPVKQKLGGIKPFPGINSIPPLVLIKKTFIFDLCTIKKLAISIIFMVFVPALVLVFTPPRVLSGEESVVQLLGLVTWYYNFAILFPIIIISSTGPLISEELKSGTMLFLVSKPINRPIIILSKFIALYLFGIVLSLLSLSIISLIALIKYPFADIGLYFGINFIYSLIIIFFFGGITIGFSSILKKPRNVLLLPLTLVIFSFLIIMMFKPLLFMSTTNWYEKYLLYNFDIGYHFANIFTWIGEFFIPEILDYFGMFFYVFGITEMVYNENDYTYDYVKTEYFHPVGSLIFLIIIGGILLIAGILIFRKRDIS